jgi:hypothetical protein
MLAKRTTLELTMKKVRMGERVAGVPEECWVARYERPEHEMDNIPSSRKNNGRNGGLA